MKLAIRVFAIVMAVMLALGVAAPLLGLRAYAAWDIGSATETDKIQIVSGRPDPNIFEKKGLYQIKVVSDNGLKFKYWNLSDGKGEAEGKVWGAPLSSPTVVFGGLTIRSLSGTWQSDDSFRISIIEADSSTPQKDPGITLASTLPDNITYKRSVEFKFKVTDYNTLKADIGVSPNPTISSYRSTAFPMQSGTSATVSVDPEGGTNAVFDVTVKTKYSGKSNSLAFDISFTDKAGENKTITCVYDVPNTKEYVEEKDDDDDDKEADPLIPYIIVEAYSYGGDDVTAGTDFTLDLLLRNTSETHSLQNIVMNIAPQGVFSMGSSSNTIYIDSLFAGSTKRIPITINTGLTKVTDDKDANSIGIKFDFQYLVDKVRKTGSSNENITIPVSFPDRFELSPPEMETMIFMGDECYIYMPMVNKGRSSVYNITASVRGDMSNPGQSQYIGNLNAGSESGAEFSVRFDTPGEQKGEIVVSYEDTNMNPKEVVMPFSLTVQEMSGPDFPDFPGGLDPEFPPEIPTDQAQKSDPKKTVMMVVALLICGISAYTTVQKAKAKRSIFENEEL